MTPDSSVSVLRGWMDVSDLSVTLPVKQQKGVKHKPGNTDQVNAVLQYMSETGYKPGLVGWTFSLRCHDFI